MLQFLKEKEKATPDGTLFRISFKPHLNPTHPPFCCFLLPPSHLRVSLPAPGSNCNLIPNQTKPPNQEKENQPVLKLKQLNL